MNWADDFKGRVDFAARCIAAGEAMSRRFDSCFENHDGDEVVVALYRRASNEPDGKLAGNLWRYISAETVLPTVERFKGVATVDLAKHAQATRDKERSRFATELTPAGEQCVIPGCERNASPKATQLGLFG